MDECLLVGHVDVVFNKSDTFTRKLQEDNQPDNDEDGVEGINLVGTTEFVGEQYASIISDAGSYSSVDAILGTLWLLIAFAAAWIGFPIFIQFSRTNKKAIVLIYRRFVSKQKDEDEEEAKKNRVEDMKAYSGRREALFNKTLSHGSAVSTGFQEYVDSLLPELYTSEDSLFHRMMAAVSSSHAITDIIEEDDPTMRTMKILHFLCEQNAAFFALAVLFDLQYPVDSGQCAAVTTEEECIAQMTFLMTISVLAVGSCLSRVSVYSTRDACGSAHCDHYSIVSGVATLWIRYRYGFPKYPPRTHGPGNGYSQRD